MKKDEIKIGTKVEDPLFPKKGVGIIEEVKKTVIKISFNGNIETYDFPHAKRFLNVVL